MNYKSMFERIDVVKKKCNKSKFGIFCDMVWCGMRYGAGYVDYDVIGFYKLNSMQRKTMLTRGINNKFVKKLNEKEYWHLFNNKNAQTVHSVLEIANSVVKDIQLDGFKKEHDL